MSDISTISLNLDADDIYSATVDLGEGLKIYARRIPSNGVWVPLYCVDKDAEKGRRQLPNNFEFAASTLGSLEEMVQEYESVRNNK